MKKFASLIFFCALLFILFSAAAQNTGSATDTTARYYYKLANSKVPEDKELLKKELYSLLKSEQEQNWLTAHRFFIMGGNPKVADSIMKIVKQRFPKGIAVRNEEKDEIVAEKNPGRKEILLQKWLKTYHPTSDFPQEHSYYYVSVGDAFAKQGDVKKALRYAALLKPGPWVAEGRAQIAQSLFDNGYNGEAEKLLKEAIYYAEDSTLFGGDKQTARMVAEGVKYYYRLYAQVLYAQNRYLEALAAIDKSHKGFRAPLGSVNAVYSQVLMALGRNNEAFDKLDEAIKAGQATPEMKKDLKILYVKAKGSDTGFDEYEAIVRKSLSDKLKNELAKKIINKPAPLFTLKDLDGNTVSLASLKGKTVVLDFWATWCGPCKRSFPAMQMAIEKYNNDTTVKFYFIHTWEREANATESAKKYIIEKKYPFHVLMDLEDPETGKNIVRDLYDISFIPVKYVIDKNGMIRFILAGYHEGDDAAVEELSAMIELAKG
jgi:thiol-disulfide isomerase/thioredoxin